MLGRSLVLLLASLYAALPAVAAMPVANAGGNEFETRYVAVDQIVTLNGSGSYGKSCDLSYAWTLASKPVGSTAVLVNAGSAKPAFSPDKPGDYVINLVVGEAGGTSDPASVTVTAISSSFPLPAKNAHRWMGLTNGLMERTLAEITLPGTHDSGAYWLDTDQRGPDFKDWSYDLGIFGDLSWDALENEVGYDLTKTQNQTLLGQLQGGIRYFDLRVTRRGGVFYTYHGLLGKPLEVLLQDIRTFLEQSEHELVVVNASHLATGTNDGNDQPFAPGHPEYHHLLIQQVVNQLGPYLYARDGRGVTELLAIPIGQIVTYGPRVLFIYSDGYFQDPDFQADPNSKWFWPSGYASGGGYTDTIRMFDSLPCPRNAPAGDRGQFQDQQCKASQYLDAGDETGFALFQTLTANEQVGQNNAICRVSLGIVCDEPQTLRELAQTVNPYLPTMLEAILPLRPSLILVDRYEESAVVSEAIRLNQRDTNAPTSQATREPPVNRYGGSFEDVTVTMTAADEQGGSGVAGIVYSLSGSQTAAPAEYCGAEAEVVVKAKGTTTVTYHAVDRAGNAGPARTLQVRADQKCDFNRDGRVDRADYAGLRHSLDDRRLWVVGDLNSDGQMSHQEWTDCLYKVLGRSR